MIPGGVLIEEPARVGRGRRIAYALLTGLAWLAWLWLWWPLLGRLAATLGLAPEPSPGPSAVPRTLLKGLAVTAALAVLTVSWSRYNLYRYGRRERRKQVPPVATETLVASLTLDPAEVGRLQAARSAVVHLDPEGRLLRVEMRARLPVPTDEEQPAPVETY